VSKAAERAIRRHIREKATIDRLIKGTRKPSQPSAEQADQDATTSTGLSVEAQVRKKWGSDKGGLPTFWRDPPAFLGTPLPRFGRSRGR
jgi:hypothetical protein